MPPAEGVTPFSAPEQGSLRGRLRTPVSLLAQSDAIDEFMAGLAMRSSRDCGSLQLDLEVVDVNRLPALQ
jgi:hypothetical protein